MKKILLSLSLLFCLLPLSVAKADDVDVAPISQTDSKTRRYVDDWYVKDFYSQITVNPDSTLDITEKITADCGNASNKHGIFRIVPEFYTVDKKTVESPVELKSITDFNGNPLKYETINNREDKTVTWKIGNPNRTVTGVNYYQIKYKVKNVVRFDNDSFDKLYWNVLGDFWDMEIDNFKADIIFPEGINKGNSVVLYYTGKLGSTGNDLVVYDWSAPDILTLESTGMLPEMYGVTALVTFPKGLISPYRFTFWEQYGEYLWFLIPIFLFIFCFSLWSKYGKDPKVKDPVIAEYEPPEGLSPLEIGLIWKNGTFYNSFMTAEIINLAVRKFITIKESEKSFFGQREKIFVRNDISQAEGELSNIQKDILEGILGNGKEKKLSALRNKFYLVIQESERKEIKELISRGILAKEGYSIKKVLILIPIILFMAFPVLFVFSPFSGVSLFLCFVISIVFAFIMPKRTEKGAELNRKIQGFYLFISKAEKYRARFYEKENMFEKVLPYAIAFGLTKQWINSMKEVYGNDFYDNYHMSWYVGAAGISSFDADSISSTISSLSSSISSSMSSSSSSSSSGGGSSGGGGGGGGGGGW